ncbi:MAG: hypothetical protein FJZ01_11005 [Candidatus Sericytochromatia bacterium]|nr:hypothetical protein [Candidatus Tanganyikabacteria bacterium]
MPKDLAKLPARELAALSGTDDDDVLEEQWWTVDHDDEEELEARTA